LVRHYLPYFLFLRVFKYRIAVDTPGSLYVSSMPHYPTLAPGAGDLRRESEGGWQVVVGEGNLRVDYGHCYDPFAHCLPEGLASARDRL
jgi:hypothetical protein